MTDSELIGKKIWIVKSCRTFTGLTKYLQGKIKNISRDGGTAHITIDWDTGNYTQNFWAQTRQLNSLLRGEESGWNRGDPTIKIKIKLI